MNLKYFTNQEVLSNGHPMLTLKNEYCKLLSEMLMELSIIDYRPISTKFSCPFGKIKFETYK